jgi:hypothetical protein
MHSHRPVRDGTREVLLHGITHICTPCPGMCFRVCFSASLLLLRSQQPRVEVVFVAAAAALGCGEWHLLRAAASAAVAWGFRRRFVPAGRQLEPPRLHVAPWTSQSGLSVRFDRGCVSPTRPPITQ